MLLFFNGGNYIKFHRGEDKMKKLKAGLLLLFSMLLSLCLFACTPADPGDDGDEPGTTTGQVTRAAFVDDDNVITLTDAETADEATRTEAFNDAVSELALNLTMSDGSRTRITGDQCDYDVADVTWGTWGTYYATVTPKTQGDVNNAGNVTATLPLEIHIGHAFGEADEDTGEATCSHCQATQTTSSLESGVEGVSYGAFHDENSFENITSGDGYGDLSQIAEFGNAVQGEYETKVYSMTAGRLRKGMSITVTGTALVKDLGNLSETEQNRQWYFPNIGIALREFDASTSPVNPDSQYDGGMSVIVRNDGHVLMNGIGDYKTEASKIYGGRLLAGLVGGSTENFNYGSHTSSSTDEYDSAPWSDYNPGDMPLDASEWNDWSVYSSGTIMRTGDYQGDTAKNIRLTWTFRLDNVVELVYENLTEGTTLVARIKIPDEYANAQFETVLHGDQIDMTFSSVSTIEQEKLESVTFNGLADGAQTVYAANEAFNFADLEDRVTVAYTQGSSATYDDFELQVNRNDAWVTLGEGDPLLATDKDFRIMVSIGSVTAYDTMSVGDDGFISEIIANNVAAVYGYRYALNNSGTEIVLDSTSFDNIGFTGNVDGDTRQVLIAPVGTAAPIPTEASSVIQNPDFGYYVALRIWGDFTALTGGVGIPGGLRENYLLYASTAEYIDVIVGVDGEHTTVTLTGVQDTPIVIDVSDVTIPVLATEVSVSGGYIPVKEGADVKLTFTVDETLWEGVTSFGFSNIPTNQVRFNELKNGASGEVGGYAYKDVSVTGGAGLPYVVTLTLTIPALTGLSDGTLTIYTRQNNAVGPTTTLYYGAPTGDGVQTMEVGGYTVYFYADGTNLYYYVASAYEDAQLAAADIAAELWLNVNGGAASPDTVLEPAFIDIGFRYANGAFVLNDATLAENSVLESSSAVYGTTDNAYDYDVGFFFAGCIDATRYGVTAGDGNYTWYFQLGTSAETANGYTVTYTAAAGETPASTAIASQEFDTSELALHTFRAGNCIEAGLFGYEFVVDDAVVFYADVLEQGGDHSVRTSGNDTCDYCGRTTSGPDLTAVQTLPENSYYEFTESYSGFTSSSSSDEIWEGINLTLTLADGTYYWIRSDSFVGANSSSAIATGIYHSFDEDGNTALRTPLGKLDPDGEEITLESYREAMSDGTVRVIVTNYNGTVTLIWSLYENGATDFASDTPFFTFTIGIPTTGNGTVTLAFGIEDMNFGRNPGSHSAVFAYSGAAVNNLYQSITATGNAITVDGQSFDRTSGLEAGTAVLDATVSGGIASGYVDVPLSGAASDLSDAQKEALGIPAGEYEDYTKYLAFTVNFSDKCAPAGVNAFVNLTSDDNTVYGVAIFNDDRTAIDVVLAYSRDLGTVNLDMVYGGAYTLQAVGISFDLAEVTAYNVTSRVENNATYTKGGTVTIAYSGLDQVESDITVTVSTVSGETTTVTGTLSGNTVTLTLPAFLTTPEGYVVELRDEAGDLINSTTVGATMYDTDSTSSGVYADTEEAYQVVVNGNQATFILTTGLENGATKSFYVSANTGAVDGEYGWYNYTFSVAANGGSATFVTGANAADNAQINVYTVGSLRVAVLTIDFESLGIADTATAYGFEFNETGVAATSGAIEYFTIAIANSVTSISAHQIANVASAEATEFVEHGENAVGYKGIAQTVGSATVFYANFEVVPSHEWISASEEGRYTCSVCGAILQSGYSTNMNFAASYFGSDEGDINATTGMTLSFFVQSASSDWDSIAMRTVYGGVNVTLPNLQLNMTNATELNGNAAIKALADKFKNTAGNAYVNAFPSAAGAVLVEGYAWNTIINSPNSYITITMGSEGIIYYLNGSKILTYPASMVFPDGATGTVAEFIELFMLCAQQSGVTIGTTQLAGQISTQDTLIEKRPLSETEVQTRYRNYLEEHNYYPSGSVVPTHPTWDTDGAFTAENATGFTAQVKLYGISQGETVVLSGAMQANAVPVENSQSVTGWDSNNWRGLVVPIYSGMNACGTLRPDDYVLDDTFASYGLACTHSGRVTTQDQAAAGTWDSAYWASVRKIFQNCTATLTVDYTSNSQIVITMQFVATQAANEYENTYTQTYTITGVNSDTVYSFGVGIDNATWTVTSFTRT